MNGRPWSKRDTWELLEYAQHMSQAEAAKRLRRTVRGVEQKMKGMVEVWRGRCVSAQSLARELGCAGHTVTAVAQALGVRTTGRGPGRRYLLDLADAERVKSVLARKFTRHAQHREAGRRRHSNATELFD